MTTATVNGGITNSLTTGQLPKWTPWVLLGGSWVVLLVIFGFVKAADETADYNIAAEIMPGRPKGMTAIWIISQRVAPRARAASS